MGNAVVEGLEVLSAHEAAERRADGLVMPISESAQEELNRLDRKRRQAPGVRQAYYPVWSKPVSDEEFKHARVEIYSSDRTRFAAANILVQASAEQFAQLTTEEQIDVSNLVVDMLNAAKSEDDQPTERNDFAHLSTFLQDHPVRETGHSPDGNETEI